MTAPARGLSACHNHTQMSDGALALDDMVRAAVRQGFSDIGISDHSCLAAEPPHATGDEAGYLAALRGAKARFARSEAQGKADPCLRPPAKSADFEAESPFTGGQSHPVNASKGAGF